MKPSLTDHLYHLKSQQQKAFAILLDPDHVPADEEVLAPLVQRLEAAQTDLILVGGSLTVDRNIHALVPLLKQLTQLPIVLFPQSPGPANCPLRRRNFVASLLSGRNPDYLIGRHVEAAPLLKQSELEILPTGYLLIDAGAPTTVNYMSNTFPIPHNKPQIAMCTALAGEQLGLRFMYLDGGSGAQRTISPQMISEVSGQLSIPLMIGGGIRSSSQAEAIWRAGADIIVVGTALEQTDGEDLLTELATIKAIFKSSSQTQTENA